jgi:BA14K-like protein
LEPNPGAAVSIGKTQAKPRLAVHTMRRVASFRRNSIQTGKHMKQAMTLFTSMTLAAAILAGAAAPAVAGPIPIPMAKPAMSDVIQVDRRDRFERQGNSVFLNGNRGFRHRQRGFREYNGFWFPEAAFLGAIIIGQALDGPRMGRRTSAHVEWCFNRYRSYRASSNSFQPYNGPRRICYSPYN